MSATVSAEQVAQIVSFVAPGFFARAAYSLRFPHNKLDEFTAVVASVVVSLPLVAIANVAARKLGIPLSPTDIKYLCVLIGGSLLIGYVAGWLRNLPSVRRSLSRILPYQPDPSNYARMLLALPSSAVVTVEFTDGRRVSGTPVAGPGVAEDKISDLVLTHPAWLDLRSGQWTEDGTGGAIIIPLSQVHNVTLDRDPTVR